MFECPLRRGVRPGVREGGPLAKVRQTEQITHFPQLCELFNILDNLFLHTCTIIVNFFTESV